MNRFVSWCNQHMIFPILGIFLGSRVMLTIIGYLCRLLIYIPNSPDQPWHYNPSPLLDFWGSWDTGWYMDIASNGYSSHMKENGEANYAFFPLYPLLVGIIGKIIGNVFIAGLLVSNIALILAAVFLYKVVRHDYGESTAMKSLLILFAFPFSFVFSGMFTESLYLFLFLLIFYFAQQRKWWAVGVTGIFLSLSRLIGVFSILPMIIEFFTALKKNTQKKLLPFLWLGLIPVGTVLFMIFNYVLSGNPFGFMTVQAAWGRAIVGPIAVLQFAFSHPEDIALQFGLWTTIISFLLIAVSWKKLKPSYLLASFYSILIPLSTNMDSMPRYILPIFPLYIAIALWCKKDIHFHIALMMLVLLQGMCMVFWSTWGIVGKLVV